MPIKICGYCKRIRPMHQDNCVYVGALQYFDAMGGRDLIAPPEPYREILDEEIESTVCNVDTQRARMLRDLLPIQTEMKRIVES
jgi:hypothetical protein